MFPSSPEEIYHNYERFLRKKNYKRAYHCLEDLAHEFPKGDQLIEQIIDLCLDQWNRLDLARKWLIRLTNIRAHWGDYLTLSHVEADLDQT